MYLLPLTVSFYHYSLKQKVNPWLAVAKKQINIRSYLHYYSISILAAELLVSPLKGYSRPRGKKT